MKHKVFAALCWLIIFSLYLPVYCQSQSEEDTLEQVQPAPDTTEVPEQIEPAGFLGIFVTSPQNGIGAKVDGIIPESPAAKAGIKKGDIILEINGESVTDEEFVVAAVGKTKPGEKVDLKIRRKGKSIFLTLKTTNRPATSFEVAPEKWLNKIERFLGINKNYLGIKACDIVPGLDEYFGVENGTLIINISEGSPAENLGLKPGDVITEIDGKNIPDTRALRNILRKKIPGSLITIRAIRHQMNLTIKGIIETE